MNPQRLLLQHFDRISEAPDAVARLRRFILDLAVRGKLVEQDPQDEPAAELLKRIQMEKARLVKEGKLKKTAIDSVGESSEAPFVLPSSWAWRCLGDVAQYGLPDKVDSNKDISVETWVLDLEDIEKDTSRLIERMTSLARPFRSTKTIFKRGDVLFGKLRPYLNKVLVADQDGVCTTEIIPIRGYCRMVPEYMKLVLKSPLTMARVDQLMYGMKMPRLGTGDAVALSLPLPPLAEQHRIVVKVDELMALCDQLQAAQNEREAQRDRLVAASLHRIGYAVNPSTSSGRTGSEEAPTSVRAEPVEAFVKAARFHLAYLPRLTTRPEHIKQLRQAIFNLAVRGRLVPQDPNDESAAELLRRIQVEKARCEKKTKEFTPVTEDDAPFDVPASWEWVRIRQITADRGQAIPIADFTYIDVTAINKERGCIGEPAVLSASEAPSRARKVVQKGDVIYSCVRPYLLNIAVIDADITPRPIASTAFAVMNGFGLTSPQYLWIALRSSFMVESVEARMRGQAYPAINDSDFAVLPMPLPPLAEQHRIVAKVDELMALCDQLEAQLTTTQTDSRRLLEAVLRDALTPAQAA